jgi:hypothetical protein
MALINYTINNLINQFFNIPMDKFTKNYIDDIVKPLINRIDTL